MAQEALDHLTNPVITEVWTLRPSEQRLCWMGFLIDVGGDRLALRVPPSSCSVTTDRQRAGASWDTGTNPVPGR